MPNTSSLNDTPISTSPMIADIDTLKQYGAHFDGIHNDSPAFNTIINQTVKTAGAKYPLVSFSLPALTVLLKTPIISGNQNISIIGRGAQNTLLLVDTCNHNGAWQHGSPQNPASGYVQVENVMVQDASNGLNNTTALAFYFDGSTIPTCTIRSTRLHSFARGLYLENPPRNVDVSTLTVYGPDFTVQPDAGITVCSTAVGKTIFTTSWSSCNILNYTWGWRFIGGGMVEGHRFWCCTCYNGWGMVQSDMNPNGIAHISNYQAVIWDFTSCDWQGYGYSLDMHNCRGIRVRGGFFTFNPRNEKSGRTVTPPWGTRTHVATNAMFAFSNCADIIMEGMQIDIPSEDVYGDCAIATFDNQCTHVRVTDNAILGMSPVFCGFELGQADASSLPPNTIKVLHNEWLAWAGGDKVTDHGSSQIDLPWIEDNFLGTQDNNGFITLNQQNKIILQEGYISGQKAAVAYVAFPQRRYMNPFFRNSIPTVVMAPQQALAVLQSPISLGESNSSGFYVVAPSSLINMEVTINYIAQGWSYKKMNTSF